MPRYSANLLDHVLAPRNAGSMDTPDAFGTASLGGRAPHVTIYLKVEGDVVKQATFQTFGCGVSIACCSVLTEMVCEMPVTDARLITGGDLIAALSGVPQEKKFCAGMAVDALQQALDKLPRSV
jgi:NifU-like protein involved in Fe-S cluster formation